MRINIWLPILLLFSCANSKTKWYSSEEICTCFSSQVAGDFDQKLGNCLTDFNNGLEPAFQHLSHKDTSISDFGDVQLLQLTKELVSTCPQSALELNKLMLTRHTSENMNLDFDRKKVTEALSKGKDSILNLLKLADLELIDGNDLESRRILEKVLKMNPNATYAHFTMVSLNYKQGDIDSAIEHISKVMDLASDDESKKGYELIKISLEHEKRLMGTKP